MRSATIVGAMLAVTLGAAPAYAQRAAICAEAADKGQQLRDQGSLLASREPFSTCASATCPVVVQRECVKWLEEVDARIPSVVVSIKDDAGRDTQARLTVDGTAVSATSGRAMRFDPGEHVFKATPTDASLVIAEDRVVLREREKDRAITLVLKHSGVARAAGATPAEAPVEPPPAPSRSIPAISWALGGLAVAGGIGYAAFWAKSRSRADELERTCSPYCSEGDVDEARASLDIARVSLAVGVVAAVAAVTIYFLQPRTTPRAAPVATLPLRLRF